ncbi:hypothetical protein OH77DRAFT_144313 [Trametes cingulata]|nr:hypothetical protein OH77DRAFT_144313 [Trametes cingulata]
MPQAFASRSDSRLLLLSLLQQRGVQLEFHCNGFVSVSCASINEGPTEMPLQMRTSIDLMAAKIQTAASTVFSAGRDTR